MATTDDLLNGIRENELASAMVELTRSIRSLRSDTAASQAAGVRFDAKLLTSIAKLADLANGLGTAKRRIEAAEEAVAVSESRLAPLEQQIQLLRTQVVLATSKAETAFASADVTAKERVDIAFKALSKRIADISTQINALPRGGFKGDPGKAGKAGPGLPKGGEKGQIPVKASDADYDITWQTPAKGGADGAFTIWNAPASSSSSATNGLPAGGTTGQVLSKVDGTDYNTTWIAVGGTGTVTSVSVVTANGVSGSVATSTTTPAITLTLGAITPTSVAASGAVTGSNLSGTNTGNQTITLTGDVTGSGTGSFAATIANNAVTDAKFRQSVARSVVGVTGNATANVADIQGAASQHLVVNAAGTALAFADQIATLSFIIDGGGSAITTGVKGDLEIPFACTITQVTTLADQSGSIVVDIWKDAYANYPPTVADTITASAKPTLSTATKAQDATLTGWTTAIAAGDTLRFNVDSITTCQRVLISLKVKKS